MMLQHGGSRGEAPNALTTQGHRAVQAALGTCFFFFKNCKQISLFLPQTDTSIHTGGWYHQMQFICPLPTSCVPDSHRLDTKRESFSKVPANTAAVRMCAWETTRVWEPPRELPEPNTSIANAARCVLHNVSETQRRRLGAGWSVGSGQPAYPLSARHPSHFDSTYPCCTVEGGCESRAPVGLALGINLCCFINIPQLNLL